MRAQLKRTSASAVQRSFYAVRNLSGPPHYRFLSTSESPEVLIRPWPVQEVEDLSGRTSLMRNSLWRRRIGRPSASKTVSTGSIVNEILRNIVSGSKRKSGFVNRAAWVLSRVP